MPGGLKQLLAIGRYCVEFGSNNGTGELVREKLEPKWYQGRVLRGKNTGWFNLNAVGAPARSQGWHKFEIEREANGSTVYFYVDGVLSRTITDAEHVLLDCVAIGSVGEGGGNGSAWFDDVLVEAFPWRFDWQSKDSLGAGLPDWMQLRETGPSASISNVQTVSTCPASMCGKTVGRWKVEGEGVHTLDMRGAIEYTVSAPEDGVFRVEIEGREYYRKKAVPSLPLVVSIDGVPLGRHLLSHPPRLNGTVHCFTPHIRAGQHQITIFWDNVQSDCSLYLEAVRLQSLLGADGNENGIPDWEENRLLSQNGIDVAPASSLVSPVCVEGLGQYLSAMQCVAGISPEKMQRIPVQEGIGDRWYVNVPLSPAQDTLLSVSFQNGGLTEERKLYWETTDLLVAPDLTIRKGDALLLSVKPRGEPEGTAIIEVAGVTNYVTESQTPVVHVFDQKGVYNVTGAFLDLVLTCIN